MSEQGILLKFGLIVALACSCLLMAVQEDWRSSFKVMKGQNFEKAIRPVFTDPVTNALVMC